VDRRRFLLTSAAGAFVAPVAGAVAICFKPRFARAQTSAKVHKIAALARYVDRVLQGTKPSDLPIEEPREFKLYLNVKTARALGLTIPRSLLLRADQVIDP